jgi:Tol biopolymer transport system component
MILPGKSDADGQETYRLNLSTRKKERVTGSDGKADPILSPNGQYIVAPDEGFQRLKLFNFATQKWSDLASGTFLRSQRWSHDSQWVYFQDYYDGIQQPIYRVHVSDGRIERVATSAQFQRSDVFHGYLFQALTPDDAPLVSLLRNKSDVYALELEFPK